MISVNDNNENKDQAPVILGTLKKQKASKPIFVLFVFILLIGISFSLPYLKDYLSTSDNELIKLINKYLGNEEVKEPDNNDNSEIVVYPLTKESSIAYENLRLSDFSITDRNLNYSIYTTDNNIIIDEEPLYLEIYTSDKELITRIKLTGKISSNEQKMTSIIPVFSFDSASIYYGKIAKLTETSYPNVTLNDNKLICELNNNHYTYSFTSLKLVQIDHVYTNNNIADLDNYLADFNYYKARADLINNISLSSSNAEEKNVGFEFKALINLTDFNQTLLKDYEDYNYYLLNTSSNLINYEMISKGFICK